MSLDEYERFVFDAGHLSDPDPTKSWQRISKEQQALTDFLNKAHEIRIVAEDTDLRYSCRGRTWINCDGHHNFPDGEVFTGPSRIASRAMSGSVSPRFTGPGVDGARLSFEHGKVVRAEAAKGQDFLRAMIAMDNGSCYLGEAPSAPTTT